MSFNSVGSVEIMGNEATTEVVVKLHEDTIQNETKEKKGKREKEVKFEEKEETKTEDKAKVMSEIALLLLSNVKSPTYNLTKEQIYWINEFINASPSSMESIDNDIKAIIAKGNIGVHSVPQIVKLCADIYNKSANESKLFNAENIVAFIRFTLEVILDSKYVVLPEQERELIKSLVDISLDLLGTNLGPIDAAINAVENSKCFVGFLGLFSCK